MVGLAARDRGYFEAPNSPHYVYADFHVADSLVYESQKCVALLLYLSQLKAELLVAVLRVFGNTMYIERNVRHPPRLLLLILRADMVYLPGRKENRRCSSGLACCYA